MNDICVKVENLSKRFFVFKTKRTALRTLNALIKHESLKKEFWILRNVSFEIKKGEKLAIIGKNGSGKTTLLRILLGIYDKTSGTFRVEGNPQALLRFWVAFNWHLSVIDNIYLFGAFHKMERGFLEDKIYEILEIAELYHLRFSSLKELSMGQIQRLGLGVFFQSSSDFLIFDESLEFIDEDYANKCEVYFQNLYSSNKTVIMTSHNNSFLRKHCKTAMWLDEGRVRMFGGVEEVIGEYARSLRI